MSQNTAISIRLKYGYRGNGRGLFNVIEVSKYDLNDANYTYILMTVIHSRRKTIRIWTTVQTRYGFGISRTVPWARFFIRSTAVLLRSYP